MKRKALNPPILKEVLLYIRFETSPVLVINNVFTGYQPSRYILKTQSFSHLTLWRSSEVTIFQVMSLYTRGLAIKSWQLFFPSHFNDDITRMCTS